MIMTRRGRDPWKSRAPRKEPDLLVGKLRIDRGRQEAWITDRPLELTSTEFAILATLVSDPGRVFRRQELVTSLWGRADAIQSRTVDVHVARLRRKLAEAGGASSDITAVYGVGYRFREREA